MEHSIEAWENTTVLDRAESLGIKVMPWARLARPNIGEDETTAQANIELLVKAARRWGCDTILPNYENEADTIPPWKVESFILQTGWRDEGKLVGWSTQAWIPNSPNFNPINDDPVLLQIFPADLQWDVKDIDRKMGDCVQHAREDKGFTYVGVTYQTYAGAQPYWFNITDYQHSTFPGNILTPSSAWNEWYK